MYVVTAIGVGIDTNVSVWDSHNSALEHMDNLLKQYDICDKQEMCTDCVKGFSKTAQCDVEIQSHYVNYNLGENGIKKSEQKQSNIDTLILEANAFSFMIERFN
jgi:hypothetical protein